MYNEFYNSDYKYFATFLKHKVIIIFLYKTCRRYNFIAINNIGEVVVQRIFNYFLIHIHSNIPKNVNFLLILETYC